MSVTSENSPRAGRIPEAVSYSGFSRWRLYKEATRHPELFKKIGRSTIVDFRVLDRLIAEAPLAKINIAT
jgi:hypothetical protein